MTHASFYDSDRTVSVEQHETTYTGAIWNVQRDRFTMYAGDDPLTREYIDHPGAVAIVAIDEQHRVAMIRQYRHPVGQDCWEIPAGLLDTDGETPLATAQRELAEETDLTATNWSVLVDHYPSAGSSAETIRIFLAQDIHPVAAEMQYERVGEEAHLVLAWVPLETALEAVLTGAIKNVNAVAGIMAAHLVITGQRPLRAVED